MRQGRSTAAGGRSTSGSRGHTSTLLAGAHRAGHGPARRERGAGHQGVRGFTSTFRAEEGAGGGCRFGLMATRPPLPPFTEETARQKVQAAEDAWNTCDPERVALAYTEGSQWRNRDEFFCGREAIVDFLRRKWARELDYRLRKELWAFTASRISVRFEYESRDPSRPVVAQPRQRALGVRQRRSDAPSRRKHQRLPDQSGRAADRGRLTGRGRGSRRRAALAGATRRLFACPNRQEA